MSTGELPKRWSIEPLGTVVEILDPQRIPINRREREQRISKKSSEELFAYYGATGQVGLIDGFLFEGESILLGEDGAPFFDPSRSKAYIVDGRYWVNNHAHILRALPGINNKFLCHQLNCTNYRPFVSGTTRLKLPQADLKRIPVKVAPTAEQERIVAKIDELFTRLDAAEAGIRKSRLLLESHLRSEMISAFASTDCERKTIGDVAHVSGGLTKSSKREKGLPQYPYLRVANVYANELRLEDVQKIGVSEGELSRVILKRADLLVVEGNGSIEQIGRVAIWDGSIENCVHQNHLIKVRFNSTERAEFALLWLLSPAGRDAIQRVASSTSGLHTLSLSKVAALPIPTPPTSRAFAIAKRLQRVMASNRAQRAVLDEQIEHINALRQSILMAAFRGELVSQNVSDEPAEKLLARVRAQQMADMPTRARSGERRVRG